jgi:glycosyltransferase involved in cell wall biosynthesis
VNARPDWARELQPDPPNFGQAKRVSRVGLALSVARRRPHSRSILRDARRYCDFESGLVSIVVLSCKRLPALRRLVESLVPFLRDVETYPAVETLLVDNGSGAEVVEWAHGLGFFDRVVAHPENLGMLGALADAFPRCRGEHVLLLEDDFVLVHDRPFLRQCLDVLAEYPEIGIVRLKNQNNWWKPERRIGPLRRTASGVEFWTWLPSRDGTLNVWASGSVLFRKVSYFATGPLPSGPNVAREGSVQHQGYLYECVYGRRYNRTWLAAKIRDCYPFVQPNDNEDSPGWGEPVPEGATLGG